MPKRRISKQQLARIKELHSQRRSRAAEKDLLDEKAELIGLLVTHYGRYADVEYNQQIYRCHFRQNLGATVVGDTVIFQLNNDRGVISAINPRESLLYRMDEKQQQKPMAANVDQMIIMLAVEPKPSLLLLDSYLVAAEILQIKPVIVFNKIDLVKNREIPEFTQIYTDLNYPLIAASVISIHGLDNIIVRLQTKTSVLVGQSGVGKSSLIKTLLPKEAIIIGKLHDMTGLGKHTTTTSKLYHLPQGGNLIDSPGIREFSLWSMSPQELAIGFIEFKPYLGKCHFRDCTHTHEPNCRVLQAVKEKLINEQRWKNYVKLLETK